MSNTEETLAMLQRGITMLGEFRVNASQYQSELAGFGDRAALGSSLPAQLAELIDRAELLLRQLGTGDAYYRKQLSPSDDGEEDRHLLRASRRPHGRQTRSVPIEEPLARYS